MSEIKTNKISPRKGTTTTITDSGDTVTVSSGANINNAGNLTISNLTNSGTITSSGTLTTAGISGSGTINNTTGTIDGLRGAVNWQTGSIKTTAFTASANEGYFCNTTSASFIVTLPASPSVGDVVGVKDYADTFDTNKLELNANGNKIQGSTTNFDITVEGTAAILLYVDSTKGWLLVDQSKASDITEAPSFINATGGTISTCGNFKIHTFTSPGTFTVTTLGNQPTVPAGGPTNVDYLVVAGGGGGGTNNGGAGGAGGYRTTFPSPSCNAGAFPVTATAFPITVGAGGVDGPNCNGRGTNGADSVFSTITSAGGGGGGSPTTTPGVGLAGGSGGGGGPKGRPFGSCGHSGGAGNTPPVSPSQGNDGAKGGAQPDGCGSATGGGGGATAAGTAGVAPGSAPSTNMGGCGGAGASNAITGATVSYAGGGGGTRRYSPGQEIPVASGAPGGTGGGGTGAAGGFSPSGPNNGENGTANTGGGAGAGGDNGTGGHGGSGIVIIRYKFQ